MLSDKAIRDYKETFKKEFGQDLTDAEAREQGERLVALVDLLLEQAQIEHRRKLRLKKEPDGFCLEEGEGFYNCRVCYQQVSGKSAWWDLNGVKCLDCQRNINEGVVPSEVCEDHDLVISNWEFKDKYGLHPSTVRKLKREGKIKGRELKDKKGTVYHTVYLVSENQGFLKKYPKKE